MPGYAIQNALKKKSDQARLFLLKPGKARIVRFAGHLTVETPEKYLDEALRWAVWNVNTAFVDNPDLGEGLIAGYGLSGERERPGA